MSLPVAHFVDDTLRRLHRTRPTTAVTTSASLYEGASGVAYFLVEAARLRSEARLLEHAERWIRFAERLARVRPKEAFVVGPGSLMTGRAGLALTRILVARACHDAEGVERGVHYYDEAWRELSRSSQRHLSELWWGTAGLYAGTQHLLSRFPDLRSSDLVTIGARAREQLLATLERPFAERPGHYVGMAHGFHGELWPLVRWPIPEARSIVATRLDELASLVERSGRSAAWSSRLGAGSFDMLHTWCHGASGHACLWTLVDDQFSPGRYRDLLPPVIHTAYLVGLGGGGSMCCGVAGNALFLDPANRARSRRLALDRIRRSVSRFGRRTDLRLWQGPLATALLAIQRAAGEHQIPGLEPPTPARQ